MRGHCGILNVTNERASLSLWERAGVRGEALCLKSQAEGRVGRNWSEREFVLSAVRHGIFVETKDVLFF